MATPVKTNPKPKGGARDGAGRPIRGKNRTTLEREARELKALQEKAKIRKIILGKDELEDLIPIVKGTVARFQAAALDGGNGAPGMPGFDPEKWKEFKEWVEFYAKLCHQTADFQSPKFKAIMVSLPPGEESARGMKDVTPAPADARAAYLTLIKGGKAA